MTQDSAIKAAISEAMKSWFDVLEGTAGGTEKTKRKIPKKTLAYCYETAIRFIKCLDLEQITYQHANEAVADFMGRDHDGYIEYMLPSCLGLFLSALYNSIPNQFILFDIPNKKPLSFVGYRLGKDKVLVLPKDIPYCVGRYKLCGMGEYNEGIIVNNASVHGALCQNSRGIGINFGNATFFGRLADKGLYVNFGNVLSFGSSVISTDLSELLKERHFIQSDYEPIEGFSNLRKFFEPLRGLENLLRNGKTQKCLELIEPAKAYANVQIENLSKECNVILVSYH